MDFPSINLNLFKKIEYFLVLRELDSQFNIQLDLSTREAAGPHKHYASWEVEKKILFWSYMYHKFLGDVIRPGHLDLKNMFVSPAEVKGSIFGNLEEKGFGKKKDDGIALNEKGRDFGNLLWYLYDIKKYKQTEADAYKKEYGALYYLKKNPWGFCVLNFQYWALILLMLFSASFVILEIMDSVHLLDNLITFFKMYLYYPKLYILILSLPVVLLSVSFFIDVEYRKALNSKYKWLEEEKKKIEKDGTH